MTPNNTQILDTAVENLGLSILLVQEEAIANLLTLHPRICRQGGKHIRKRAFGASCPDDTCRSVNERLLVETSICLSWLQKSWRRETINKKISTYGWKHVVEKAAGVYIPEGAFILACLIDGDIQVHLSCSGAAYVGLDPDNRYEERD